MTSEKLWIGVSWKMNKVLWEAEHYARTLAAERDQLPSGIQAFVIPPFTLLRDVKKLLDKTGILIGAQNMHWADEGAWTGEISPGMLVDCGVDLVEIGHSERRQHFGETDNTVGLKTAAALRHGLTPLICVGENQAERDAGIADSVLETQVQAALSKIADAQRARPIILSYEPVWAIGEEGTAASPEYANARQAYIASLAHSLLGHDVPCLYGGSVTEANCHGFILQPHIDGLFVGRAAWEVADYCRILKTCGAVLNQ